MNLQGKRAFVTGAASGIGAATVAAFRAYGATVVGVDITAADGVEYCDVTDAESVRAAMARATEAMGGLDVCANVAGIDKMASFEDVSVELLDKHLAVNVRGPMLVTQAALPHLRASKGNVVTIASISSTQGQPYNSAYCASKGAVLVMMKSLAVELAPEGIRVNCVCPGGVNTPLRAGAASTLGEGADLSAFDRMINVMPGDIEPTEIADALAYLASDAARSITGAALVVDRGILF